ncbi:MAG: hypothetical protein ACYSVY_06835, partial [Planctomycetota bacterium]
MFGVNMICHLWDFLDEGVEEVLDRLQGELGVTGVCVPVVCGPLSQLRCRPDAAPRVFRSRGGLFFAPDDAYYQGTRCKPPTSEWLKSRNPLQQIADGCHKRGLACRGVVDTSSVALLAARHPQAAAKTVFGDAWPDRVCLVNPDVQALFVGLCRDLVANYGLKAIELSEFHSGRIGQACRSLVSPFGLGRGAHTLLGLCFCESCRQRSDRRPASNGAEVGSAARSAEMRLRRIFETGQPLDLAADRLLADEPPLRAYVEGQWRAIADLLEAICRDSGCPVILHTYQDLIHAGTDPHPLAEGGAIRDLSGVLTHVANAAGSEAEEAARTVVGLAGPSQSAEVQIRPYAGQPPESPPDDAPALVRSLSRLVELGVRSVNLDNYGQLPETAWSGIKQATR